MKFDNTKIAHKYLFGDVIDSEIRELYKGLNDGHGIEHIMGVTNCMIYLADEMGMDPKIAALIGAYHDIGLIFGDRDNHHELSKEWVCENMDHISNKYDVSLRNILDVADAVYEHRSSMKKKSSLWSMMISDADKLPTHNAADIISRAWIYTENHFPGLTLDEKIDSVYRHVSEKFGTPNYYGNKFYLPISNMIAGDIDFITVMNTKDMVSEMIRKTIIKDKEV